MDNYHIVPSGNGWKFKKEKSQKSIKNTVTKSDVMKFMKDYMKDHEGSVKIHKENGKFQEERTYPRSKDPRITKG